MYDGRYKFDTSPLFMYNILESESVVTCRLVTK